MCHFKTTGQKSLIFEYVNLEVYRVDWSRVEWAGPAHLGHTPTLQMGLLQYKIVQPVWLLSHTVIEYILSNFTLIQDANLLQRYDPNELLFSVQVFQV